MTAPDFSMAGLVRQTLREHPPILFNGMELEWTVEQIGRRCEVLIMGAGEVVGFTVNEPLRSYNGRLLEVEREVNRAVNRLNHAAIPLLRDAKPTSPPAAP